MRISYEEHDFCFTFKSVMRGMIERYAYNLYKVFFLLTYEIHSVNEKNLNSFNNRHAMTMYYKFISDCAHLYYIILRK